MAVVRVFIHRHTGGLEMLVWLRLFFAGIHRHTGGLEKTAYARKRSRYIHRHTGGLEKYFEQRQL